MGICASCLGRRGKDDVDEDEESPLFLDDGNGMHYGSFGHQHMTSQDDPLEAQRENEALQQVVARTSDSMVDIFEITAQDAVQIAPAPYTYAGQDARVARYQNLLSKLSEDNDGAAHASVDWLVAEDDTIEMQRGIPGIKLGAGEPLVGTFADAAAA